VQLDTDGDIGMRPYLHNLVIPGVVPSEAILLISIIAVVAIFGLDMADGREIWCQVLYLFPVCAIALLCERFMWVVLAVLLAVVFQQLTFRAYQISAPSVVANSIHCTRCRRDGSRFGTCGTLELCED
jgi:hypothetical protein